MAEPSKHLKAYFKYDTGKEEITGFNKNKCSSLIHAFSCYINDISIDDNKALEFKKDSLYLVRLPKFAQKLKDDFISINLNNNKELKEIYKDEIQNLTNQYNAIRSIFSSKTAERSLTNHLTCMGTWISAITPYCKSTDFRTAATMSCIKNSIKIQFQEKPPKGSHTNILRNALSLLHSINALPHPSEAQRETVADLLRKIHACTAQQLRKLEINTEAGASPGATGGSQASAGAGAASGGLFSKSKAGLPPAKQARLTTPDPSP